MEKLYVVIRHGAVLDRIQEIMAAETIIGRDADCGLRLPDICVSRKHARVFVQDDNVFIRDMHSRNGTHLIGSPIRNDALIVDGTEVQIGPFGLKFCFSIGASLRESVGASESTHTDIRNTDTAGRLGKALEKLTPTQFRVYELFLQGLIEKEVAARLGVTINTIHDHAKAIYKKLSVSTRGELFLLRDADASRRTSPGL
jgi:pSer/pThr/pTyr-binding forkhead associated (FHA) protein